MNSLVFVSYLEKRAKNNAQLQDLMQRATDCIQRMEQLKLSEKELQLDNLKLTQDEFDLRRIAQAQELNAMQNREAFESWRSAYVSVTELCLRVDNIDSKTKLETELKLLQMQSQQEVLEAAKRYEQERHRAEQLEAREIVQKYRKAQADKEKLNATIENYNRFVGIERKNILEKCRIWEQRRNESIVSLVTQQKHCEELKKELELLKDPLTKIPKLKAQKAELIEELRRLNIQLPDIESPKPPSVMAMASFATSNFNTFTKLNVNKVAQINEVKFTFQEFIAAWQTKQQIELRNVSKSMMQTEAFKPLDAHFITKSATLTESSDTISSTTVDVTKPFASIMQPLCASLIEKSTDDEDINSSPKSTVHLVSNIERCGDSSNIEDIATGEDVLMTPTDDEVEPRLSDAAQSSEKLADNDDQITDDVNIVKSQSQYVEKISAKHQPTQTEANEQDDNVIKQRKLKATSSLTAPSMSKKAKSELQLKTQVSEPKIEIRESRIIKPSGPPLPKTLRFNLTPDVTFSAADAMPKSPDNSTKDVPKEKQEIFESDTFYSDFLKSSLESLHDNTGDVAEYNVEKSKTGSKETKKMSAKSFEAAFENFFMKSISSNKTGIDNETESGTFSKAQKPADTDNDELFDFDMSANDNFDSDAVDGGIADNFCFTVDSADDQYDGELTENFF